MLCRTPCTCVSNACTCASVAATAMTLKYYEVMVRSNGGASVDEYQMVYSVIVLTLCVAVGGISNAMIQI